MISPFRRAVNKDQTGLSLTEFIPEVNDEAEWFFNEPSIATREYNGYLMRHTLEGWQYHTHDGWQAVYPKNNYWKQFLQVITNRWSKSNSPFLHVENFEDAESPFTEEYEIGEYWLVPPWEFATPAQIGTHQSWYLIPVNRSEQLSNINELNLHLIEDPVEVFNVLKQALEPLRDNIYGVIFTSSDGKRVRVRPRDFNW